MIEKWSVKAASEILEKDVSTVRKKAKRLKLLHFDEGLRKYYIHDHDLYHFWMDYRKGDHRQRTNLEFAPRKKTIVIG